jgi:hypothetical protein
VVALLVDEFVTKAEIYEYNIIIIEHDVLRFEVIVGPTNGVDISEAVYQLYCNLESEIFRDSLFLL